MIDKQIIDLTIIDQKYKDKCSLIKAGKCKNVNIFIEQSRKLKRKEQECEELKMKNSILEDEYKILEGNLDSRTRDFEEVIDNYKQTLTEIKEIAENAYCLTNGTNKDMAQFAKQILQKISEVEYVN